jgi:glycosyltransferase involved in cell wall biosynthesis
MVVFSERLRAPYDEGIKSFAAHLAGVLAVEHDVLTLTTDGANDSAAGIVDMPANRLLLSIPLRRAIYAFQPQAIVYVPTACGTVFSFVRASLLRLYGRGACTALITLQPRPHSATGRAMIRLLAPDWVMAQSQRTARAFAQMGCRSALLPPAVNGQHFRPASREDRSALRDKHGIPQPATVVTHIGHLKGKRSLSQFLALQGLDGYHTVLVASTSTQKDATLKQELQDAGTTVIDTYVEHVEEIYQLSDVYLFLAEDDTAAIELPLSVLEAMACNLPIVCTPFGGLRDFFEEGRGLVYYHGQSAVSDSIEVALSGPCTTRSLVEPHTWSALARTLVRHLQESTVKR